MFLTRWATDSVAGVSALQIVQLLDHMFNTTGLFRSDAIVIEVCWSGLEGAAACNTVNVNGKGLGSLGCTKPAVWSTIDVVSRLDCWKASTPARTTNAKKAKPIAMSQLKRIGPTRRGVPLVPKLVFVTPLQVWHARGYGGPTGGSHRGPFKFPPGTERLD